MVTYHGIRVITIQLPKWPSSISLKYEIRVRYKETLPIITEIISKMISHLFKTSYYSFIKHVKSVYNKLIIMLYKIFTMKLWRKDLT
jgi:hypothetical protein